MPNTPGREERCAFKLPDGTRCEASRASHDGISEWCHAYTPSREERMSEKEFERVVDLEYYGELVDEACRAREAEQTLLRELEKESLRNRRFDAVEIEATGAAAKALADLAREKEDKRVPAYVGALRERCENAEKLNATLLDALREMKAYRCEQDCRYTMGNVADIGGRHCPFETPCVRCRLDRAEEDAENHRLDNQRLQADIAREKAETKRMVERVEQLADAHNRAEDEIVSLKKTLVLREAEIEEATGPGSVWNTVTPDGRCANCGATGSEGAERDALAERVKILEAALREIAEREHQDTCQSVLGTENKYPCNCVKGIAAAALAAREGK